MTDGWITVVKRRKNPIKTTDVYEHSLSAETIGHNVDLLTTILLRVPAKSLARFKCVSKQWLSLISDTKFCNDHTRKNLNPPVSGLYISCSDSRLINFKTKTRNGQQSLPKLDFLNMEVTIKQSCNGLLLCTCDTEIIVCNPTVRKFKVVPHYKKPSLSVLLSFSPLKSPYFKVISLKSTDEPIGNRIPIDSYDIGIYYSESGMWETIDVCEPYLNPLSRYVLCDGAVYWMVEGNNLRRFDIDAKSMTTHQTSLDPEIFSSGIFNDRVLYFRGHGQYLTLIHSNSRTQTVMQILEMDTRNFRWTIKYNLNLGRVIEPHLAKKYYRTICVLYFKVEDEDEEETPALFIAKATSREIVMCNLKSKRWENILEEETKLGKLPLDAYEFIESLALF